MYSILVATTDDRELPAAEIGPGLTWERLCDVLRIEVSPEAAALFAEPVADPTRGLTHWHIVATEDPKPFLSLGRPEQDKLLEAFHKLRAQILAYADRLAAAGGETNLRLALGLRSAVETTDQNAQLWSVAGAPLLTGWGRRKTSALAGPAAIVGRRAFERETGETPARGRAFVPGETRAAAAPPRAAPAAFSPLHGEVAALRRRAASPLWLWLLFAFLVATIYYRLLPACGIDAPLLGRIVGRCSGETGARLRALAERNDSLRAAIFEAQRRIAANCMGPADAKAEPEAVRPSVEEAKKRVGDAGLPRGKLDVTLAWDGREDLDLHIYCPGGHLYFLDRNACGGTLDRDQNKSIGIAEDRPIEHAAFEQEPPPGEMRIVVVLFSRNGLLARPVPFTVVVREGDSERAFPGVADKERTELEATRLRR